jgi:hypothetical protein
MRQPGRRVRRQPHADHAAERQAAEREALEAQRVGERKGVAAELIDGVVAGRHAGGAVAAGIEADHLEVTGQIDRLRLPHGQIQPERV